MALSLEITLPCSEIEEKLRRLYLNSNGHRTLYGRFMLNCWLSQVHSPEFMNSGEISQFSAHVMLNDNCLALGKDRSVAREEFVPIVIAAIRGIRNPNARMFTEGLALTFGCGESAA